MAHTLYELDVRLRAIEPPIWRTIEISGTASLDDLHYAIQVAMGWTNSHLHHFVIKKKHYSVPGPHDGGLDVNDDKHFNLEDVVAQGDTFNYDYDFGDDWEHAVTVTQVTTQAKTPKARCTAGARACPPEDCGGPQGYQKLITVLADPTHPEHQDATGWAGGYRAEDFAVPKGGLDLQKQMTGLRKLAEERAPGMVGPDSADAPDQLVDLVLSLPPMQRASLCALIAESLAEDVLEIAAVAEKLVQQAQPKPARHQRLVGRGRRH